MKQFCPLLVHALCFVALWFPCNGTSASSQGAPSRLEVKEHIEKDGIWLFMENERISMKKKHRAEISEMQNKLIIQGQEIEKLKFESAWRDKPDSFANSVGTNTDVFGPRMAVPFEQLTKLESKNAEAISRIKSLWAENQRILGEKANHERQMMTVNVEKAQLVKDNRKMEEERRKWMSDQLALKRYDADISKLLKEAASPSRSSGTNHFAMAMQLERILELETEIGRLKAQHSGPVQHLVFQLKDEVETLRGKQAQNAALNSEKDRRIAFLTAENEWFAADNAQMKSRGENLSEELRANETERTRLQTEIQTLKDDNGGLRLEAQQTRRAYCQLSEECGAPYIVSDSDSGAADHGDGWLR